MSKQKIDAAFIKEAFEQHEQSRKAGSLRMHTEPWIGFIPSAAQKQQEENRAEKPEK